MAIKTQYETLENAPLILAILEIRYTLPNDFNIHNFQDIKGDLMKLYSTQQNKVVGNISLEDMQAGTQTSLNPILAGFVYISEDKKKTLSLSLNSFNFQNHGKYNKWDSFIQDARKSWDIVKSVLNQARVTGISVRYINRIEFNEQFEDSTEYFNTNIVSTSEAQPSNVSSYLIRYIDVNKENNTHAIVTQSLEPGDGNVLPFMFDIDVHYNGELDDDVMLWEKFDELRTMKNDIFFKNLTEKTKKMLK